MQSISEHTRDTAYEDDDTDDREPDGLRSQMVEEEMVGPPRFELESHAPQA